jgi:hypothetical protein
VMQILLNLFMSLTLRRRQMMLCMRWSWKKSWGRLVRLMVRFRGLFGWILITGCLCWPSFAAFLLAKPLFIASHVTNHVWLHGNNFWLLGGYVSSLSTYSLHKRRIYHCALLRKRTMVRLCFCKLHTRCLSSKWGNLGKSWDERVTQALRNVNLLKKH